MEQMTVCRYPASNTVDVEKILKKVTDINSYYITVACFIQKNKLEH